MEHVITVHIEALEEGGYLATSNQIQGLVAQGRTVQETMEIARDVARRLMEARAERAEEIPLRRIEKSFDLSLVVGG